MPTAPHVAQATDDTVKKLGRENALLRRRLNELETELAIAKNQRWDASDVVKIRFYNSIEAGIGLAIGFMVIGAVPVVLLLILTGF